MPIILTPLKPNDTGQAVADLHRQLLNIGAPIAEAERNSKRFGSSTVDALVAFRDQNGLPRVEATASPFDASVARLLNVAVAAVVGNRTALRAAVRESIAAGTPSPQENYWLARYAVIAGDYSLARRAAARAPGLSSLVAEITATPRNPRTQPPRPPEVPYPENFYTYLYNLIPQESLDELLRLTATNSPGVPDLIMFRAVDSDMPGEGPYPDDPFDHDPEDDLPPGPPAVSDARKKQLAESADAWLKAVNSWQLGNAEFKARRYASAVSAYTECQQQVLTYFYKFYADVKFGWLPTSPFPDLRQPISLDERINRLVLNLAHLRTKWNQLLLALQERRLKLSLEELGKFDWSAIPQNAIKFLTDNISGLEDPIGLGMKTLRQRSLDRPMVILATVMVPLARAEANRLRRQFDAAEKDLQRVLSPYQLRESSTPPTKQDIWLTCDFIELPFARLLLADTILDKAEVQYKARTIVAEEDHARRDVLVRAATDYKTRFGDGHSGNQEEPFRWQLAAYTYLAVFELFKDEGAYVSRVNQGTDALVTKLKERLEQDDVTSRAFEVLGNEIMIPTLQPVEDTLPGIGRAVGPHEPLLKFQLPPDQAAMRETNPRVYAALLTAEARLLQLWSWFNYLGYTDDYVPPWRFLFLLDRARYFAEHARNAQREYLNFLVNAEHEEFQELSAAQNVEMEKSNVRIETARVDQVRLEVAASKASQELATLTASDAQTRFGAYSEMDKQIRKLEQSSSFWSAVSGIGSMAAGIAGAAVTGGALATVAIGSAAQLLGQTQSGQAQTQIASEQRQYEKLNLRLAAAEANQSEIVARRQLMAAQAGLVVAGLQRQAALLRHEFAVQNLNFLRNRMLNAELWYRLSYAIRTVADTYLRYAVEMAFLAEQAYEFEADRRLNVIRFDYDVSELVDMLAGDFLLRDLDTLEQDLIVGQRLRQQQVRYVLSLAREFPAALQELRENGQMIFSLRLESLERRFPGLFNLRITSAEVLPLALMDATRFSLELTQLGTGQVRLKAEPNTSPETETLNPPDVDDWLEGLETDWPVKVRVTGPETAVYSGLTRQDLAGLPSLFVSNERGAFEGTAAASSWKIDFSTKENRIVPETLADVVITFTLSGYYDGGLREAVAVAPRKETVLTTWFSAHRDFPDDFYQLNRTGRMDWNISPDFFPLEDSLGVLRNVSVLCLPLQKRPELGRIMCSYPIEFTVDSAGHIDILRDLPLFAFSTNELTLNITLNTPGGSEVTFDFGDGTGLVDSTALPHRYARPGRYDVLVRISLNGRLTEYHAAVVLSQQHAVLPPCVAVPAMQTTVTAGKIRLAPSLQSAASESLSMIWLIDNQKPDDSSDPVTFTLEPGRYILRFAAIRPLTCRFYSQQRYAPGTLLHLEGLHLATNRKFNADTGAEETTSLNEFGQHVFGGSTLSPTDRWSFELPLDDNPCALSVSSTDVKKHDLSELSDTVLALEYTVRDR